MAEVNGNGNERVGVVKRNKKERMVEPQEVVEVEVISRLLGN